MFDCITVAPNDWFDNLIMISEIEVVFCQAGAIGLMIFNVALWSRVTFNISMPRICVSVSLCYFLPRVDMEKAAPLPALPELPYAADEVFKFYSGAAGLD